MTVDEVKAAVTASAQKWGVDPELALAIASNESSFGQNAGQSSAGAIGIMQLMPKTAAGLGVDPYNPSQNIDGGVHLLSQLLNQFNGDPLLAAAAYNDGSGNLSKILNGLKAMPAETSNYIAKVARYLGIGSTENPFPPADTSLSAESAGVDLSAWDSAAVSSTGANGWAWAAGGLGLLLLLLFLKRSN